MLTHRDYMEWLRFYECDPWGEDRADLRAAQVAASAIAPYAKKTPKVTDFMPYLDGGKKRTEPMDQAQAKAILETAVRR